jgi:hypothetical protein
VGRTLLSDAFDVDFDFVSDSDFDSNREGHGFSRAEKDPPNSTRLQPCRKRPTQFNPASAVPKKTHPIQPGFSR